MIYSCAKNKISMICQQLGRGFNDQNIQKKKEVAWNSARHFKP